MLRYDAAFAASYLDDCLADGEPQLFLLALRQVAEARGIGMSELARNTNLDRAGLYRMLSETGNPELTSISTILSALGFKLEVKLAS